LSHHFSVGITMLHKPQSTSAVASRARSFIVYDRKSGAVFHVHHTVEFATGLVSRESHESRARRLSGATVGDIAAVLEVSTDEFGQATPIRVDPVTLAIKWEPRRQRTMKGTHSPK
jgi:hypothetical protein